MYSIKTEVATGPGRDENSEWKYVGKGAVITHLGNAVVVSTTHEVGPARVKLPARRQLRVPLQPASQKGRETSPRVLVNSTSMV
ncbi:hypothetical protein VTO42DRAFT_3164 [Malbranchea cinnamomea]